MVPLLNCMDLMKPIGVRQVVIVRIICLFRIGKIIEDIETEKKKLISNRDVVQEKVEATDKKTEKVNDAVFEWLKEMEKLTEDEENLKTIIGSQFEFPNHNCLAGVLCVDHQMRCGMYDEMLKRIKELNANCEFEPFSSPIPALDFFSSGNFACFEPMKEASDRLLEAVQDDNCHIIGLYGKRGAGKTKLAKAVGEKAKYLNIFYVVLFVTVSQNPNVRRIQDEIADSLNLKFDKNTTEAGRARKIYLALENMNRPILVILDDVRAKLDPEDIGIPCNSIRCKILLTTRHQRECALMDCQREIPLGTLSKEEALTLLKKHSGIDDKSESSLDLLNVAREVAHECEVFSACFDLTHMLSKQLLKRSLIPQEI